MRNFCGLHIPDDCFALYITGGQSVEKKKFDLQVAFAEEFGVNHVLFCIILNICNENI
jgi:hypothetical protein